jgi:hypothetical protein
MTQHFETYKKGGKVKKKRTYTQKQKQSINIHIDNSRKTHKRKPSDIKPPFYKSNTPQFTTQVMGGYPTAAPAQPINLSDISQTDPKS